MIIEPMRVRITVIMPLALVIAKRRPGNHIIAPTFNRNAQLKEMKAKISYCL